MLPGKRIDPNTKTPYILADWRTGAYSTRDLAKMHKVSQSFVAENIKGVEQDTKELVMKISQHNQELTELGGHAAVSVVALVDAKERIRNAIEKVVEQSVQKASELMEVSESGSDYAAIMMGLDRGSITVGVNERHAKPSLTLNQMQNNYTSLSITDIEREIREIEQRQAS